MPESSLADVNDAVKSCQTAQIDWSNRSSRQRGEVLQKAATIIRVNSKIQKFTFQGRKYIRSIFIFQENLEDIAQLETVDTGKPIYESRMDTEGCADAVSFFAGLAATISGKNKFPSYRTVLLPLCCPCFTCTCFYRL